MGLAKGVKRPPHRALTAAINDAEYWRGYIAARAVANGDCLEYAPVDAEGYGRIGEPPLKGALAHRVSYAAHNGADPGPLQVNHSCDNPPCVRAEHLTLGTQRRNIQERNERHPRYLTAAQRMDVERLTRTGRAPKAIARVLGISAQSVQNWRKRNGYAPINPRVSEQRRAVVARMRAQGKGWQDISDATGASVIALKADCYRQAKKAQAAAKGQAND